MKKTYSKPQLYVESFELSEHIAACSGYESGLTTANHWSNSNCQFITSDGTILFSLGNCDFPYFKDMELICYNSPSDNFGTPFAS